MLRFTGFAHLLRTMAALRGDRPALASADAPEGCLSFAQLLRAAEQAAERLRAGGGTCLAVVCDGSAACVTEIFGSVLAGMQTVLLDGMLPDETLALLVRASDADRIWCADEDLAQALRAAPGTGVTEGAGRILFFTSGTTAQARAVVLTDGSLMASAWNGSMKLPVRPEDTVLCMLPLAHVFGFVCGLLWGLCCGACVALGRGARYYAQDCAFFRPTVLPAVPLLFGFLMKQKLLNPELRLVLIGAGDCPSALLDGARAAGLSVSFGYGLTETSSGVALSTSGDPYAMELCPDDTAEIAPDGEALLRAPTCMMQGYYKDPAATQAVLQNGVLHTGDLGFLDGAGRLHITGRKKDVLVLADGSKIFCPEYEAKLSAALQTASLAVVLSGGKPALVLEADSADETRVRAALAAFNAQYPRGQQIAAVIPYPKKLPRTATGKLRRWQLQEELNHGTR